LKKPENLLKDNDMIQQHDEIVAIPANRLRYFGGAGKMLLPCPATIVVLIRQIPDGQLVTTTLMLEQLADDFDVDGVCPVTTRKSLHAAAHDPNVDIPYWRVIKPTGELMAMFPGGVAAHAARLSEAGFTIDTKGKAPRVRQFKDSLVQFG
jgi:alkylated DNA nucleotide flippase Atl1